MPKMSGTMACITTPTTIAATRSRGNHNAKDSQASAATEATASPDSTIGACWASVGCVVRLAITSPERKIGLSLAMAAKK